jgi:hypothetical protein
MRGLAGGAVAAVIVSLLWLLHDQFHDRTAGAAGNVLAGAFAVWWLLAAPSRPRLARGEHPVEVAAWLVRGLLIASAITYYAAVRPDDVRVDPTLAAFGAVVVGSHVVQMLVRREAAEDPEWPRARLAARALKWIVCVGLAAGARVFGEGAAYVVFWVPETAVGLAPGWSGWLLAAVIWPLWSVVVLVATGIVQFRTVQLEEITYAHGYAGHITENSHQVATSRLPRRTGLSPMLSLTASSERSWSNTIGSGFDLSSHSTTTSSIIRHVRLVEVPPRYVPMWWRF